MLAMGVEEGEPGKVVLMVSGKSDGTSAFLGDRPLRIQGYFREKANSRMNLGTTGVPYLSPEQTMGV